MGTVALFRGDFVAARAHLEDASLCSDANLCPILYAEYCYRRGSYLAF